MPEKVSVVVLNYNGASDTLQCIASLKKLSNLRVTMSIIVVDNCSTDSSVEVLKTVNDIVLIEAAHNGGFGSGNNIGIDYALALGSEYIWLLNNDTVVRHDTLELLYGKIETEPSLGVVGGILYYPDKTVQIAGGGAFNKSLFKLRPFKGGESADLDYISGACMFFRSKCLVDTGGFDTRFFMYWEDIDLSLSILDCGWRLAVADDTVITHKESASLKDENNQRSVLFEYYNTESLTKFVLKRRSAIFLLIPLSYRIFSRLVCGKFLSAKAVISGFLSASK